MIIMIEIDMMKIGTNLFMRKTKINKVEEMRNSQGDKESKDKKKSKCHKHKHKSSSSSRHRSSSSSSSGSDSSSDSDSDTKSKKSCNKDKHLPKSVLYTGDGQLSHQAFMAFGRVIFIS